MRDRTLRKLGLGSCMLLAIAGPMSLASAPALAQISCTVEDDIRTCVNTVTTEIVSVEQIPLPISAQQFANNPALLLQNTSNLGNSVTGLLQQGVSPSQISNVLSQAGIGTSGSQWNSILNSIGSGSNINPAMASTLVNSVFAGQVSPQIGQALAGINNLGNINSVQGLTNLLNSSGIRNALAGLTTAEAGAALDQILQAGIGNALNAQAIQGLLGGGGAAALTNAISNAVPGLSSLLGAGGLQNALSGTIGNLASGALGGVAGGLLGAGLTGGIGGAVSSALGIGSVFGGGCCIQCQIEIPQHHNQIRNFITTEFQEHEDWMINTFFNEHVLPAMMLFAEQLTLAGMYQVEIIGAMLDAKHQLETQRIFQQLTARAHKDYHPSEGMCTFGTTVRSLAQSERKTNMAQIATATRMMQRQALNGEAISYQGPDSDMRSRLNTYISTYCDQADNQNRLNYLCPNAVPDAKRRNIDVDFTRNIESRLTLDLEFADIQDSAGNTPDNTGTVTPDEQDVFALAANLYSHNVSPTIEAEKLGNAEQNRVRVSAAEKYIDLRSIYAKRSVAQNSFAALVGMRAAGDPESAPYVKKVMQDLGVSDPEDIEKLLGKNPSYFAQMEVLTKKLYQNPIFYTELYDKPANIKRKGAALQAIGLMQDRDLYNSFLRSEAVLSVLLETQLERAQEKVTNQGGNISTTGGGTGL